MIVCFKWDYQHTCSVNNATLNRFFSLHFLLPFVLAALALMHLIVLHDTAGSGNPLGVSGNYERIPFAPYFLFKDLITIWIYVFVLSLFVFFMPNVLGDSENYVVANPMQTPAAIVPEWYLLPFYAILRSIPNKLLGVIAMFSAILALLLLPITDVSRSRGMQFRPLCKIGFYVFIANLIILMQLGAKHVESPFIEFGQISTTLYFLYFIFLMLSFTLIENTLLESRLNAEVSQEYSSEVTPQYSFKILHSGYINSVSLQILYLFYVFARVVYHLFVVYVWPDTLLFLDTIKEPMFESMFTISNLFDLDYYDLKLFDFNLYTNNTEAFNSENYTVIVSIDTVNLGSFNVDYINLDTIGNSGSDVNQCWPPIGDPDYEEIFGEPEDPVPGRRCPACLDRGDTVWVIPGKCCPQCGTPVN